MANMSYCRFENTYADLAGCVVALDRTIDGEDTISERELFYARQMRDLCEQYLELVDKVTCQDDDEDEDDDECTLLCPHCQSDSIGVSVRGTCWKCFDCGQLFDKPIDTTNN